MDQVSKPSLYVWMIVDLFGTLAFFRTHVPDQIKSMFDVAERAFCVTAIRGVALLHHFKRHVKRRYQPSVAFARKQRFRCVAHLFSAVLRYTLVDQVCQFVTPSLNYRNGDPPLANQ